MISIIVCYINPAKVEAFRANVLETIGLPCEFIFYDNRETGYSITHVYNLCAEKAKGEYLCFAHEDIFFRTPNWGERIVSLLQKPTTGVEESAQAGFVFLADLAQHPTRSFAYEVVLVVEQQVGQSQGIVEVTAANPLPGGDDGDTLFPKLWALSQTVERGMVAVFEIAPYDLRGREVYQVPVVDTSGVGQIGVVQGRALGFVGFLELLDHAEESCHAQLVHRTMQQSGEFGKWSVEVLLGDTSCDRNGHPDENIVFAIFSLSGFEESRENFCFCRIGCCPDGFLDILSCVHGDVSFGTKVVNFSTGRLLRFVAF